MRKIPIIMGGSPSLYPTVVRKLKSNGFSEEKPFVYTKWKDEECTEVRKTCQSEATREAKLARLNSKNNEAMSRIPFTKDVIEKYNQDDSVHEIYFVGIAGSLISDLRANDVALPYGLGRINCASMIDETGPIDLGRSIPKAYGKSPFQNFASRLPAYGVPIRKATSALTTDTLFELSYQDPCTQRDNIIAASDRYAWQGYSTLEMESWGLKNAKKPVSIAHVISDEMANGECLFDREVRERMGRLEATVGKIVYAYIEMGRRVAEICDEFPESDYEIRL